MQNNSPQQIYDAIINSNKIILCIDSRPDFDAFGSGMAFYEHFGKELNKNIRVIYSGTIPPRYFDYFDLSNVEQNVDPNKVKFDDYDLWVSLDSGELAHISINRDFVPPKDLTILNIDHHSTNEYFGKYNYVDKKVSSASYILYELFKKWDVKMSQTIQKYLYLGVLTDTGFLSYNNTTDKDHLMIADLMQKGLDTYGLIDKLTNNISEDEMKFRGIVYKNLKIDYKVGYAYTTTSLKEIKDANIDMLNVFSRASDLIKSLVGVDFVFSIIDSDLESDLYDVSFRSHNMDYDVAVYAQMFEGGGHKVAAGGRLKAKSMDEAVQKVIQTITKPAITT